MKTKRELGEEFAKFIEDQPALLGIRAFPIIYEDGNISLGAKCQDGTMFNTFRDAVQYECDKLVEEHYEWLTHEFIDISNKLQASDTNKRNQPQDVNADSLFQQIINTSSSEDEAMTTLKFMQLKEKQKGTEILWNDDQISQAIISKIIDYYG